MTPVAVRLLHAEPASGGPIERAVADVRGRIAAAAAESFRRAGAADVAVLAARRDDTPFGARLRELVRTERPGGLVVAGSGTLALARPADLLPFLETAASTARVALANNRYSADVVAIACAGNVADVPDLPADNALPRWLEEACGYEVRDVAHSARLQLDVDGPLDALLARQRLEADTRRAEEALRAVARVAADPRAELLVAGRTSGRALRWLERGVASRVRAIVEERGLRATTPLARADGVGNRRPPRSIVGRVLDAEGPAALGPLLSGLADAAVVDTRVLLAHHAGPDERDWPRPEDRFASDLLLADRIRDPWLRALTASAVDAPIPVVLGGHTLVGPGLSRAVRYAP